jgi:plastocyanin
MLETMRGKSDRILAAPRNPPMIDPPTCINRPHDRSGRASARARSAFLSAALLAPCTSTQAATFSLGIDDGRLPVAEAVVSLHSAAAAEAVAGSRAELNQSGSQFVPRVLAVTRGTAVTFPNRDRVRHHVYSFSPAKRFELPLYAGSPAAPVVFETPGLVTLGCNIHDWMVAYVLVLDTPYFGKTDATGEVRLEAPPGDYVMRVWHEGAGVEQAAVEQAVTLPAAGLTRRLSLASADAAARMGPSIDGGGEGTNPSDEASAP